jgi:hypothetical protein
MYFPTGSTPSSVAIGDLDRDGHADLVVTNSAVYSESRISSISILRGNGDGTFAPGRVIPVGNVPQAVVIEDLDGDGFPDLAIANFGESPAYVGSVSVMMGYGDGTFRSAVDYTAGNMVRSLSAADLDGDGDLDLVTEDAVLLNNGDGTFGAAAAYGYDYADWLVAVGDLNRDGHPDLVTSDIDAEPGYDDEPGMWAYTVRLGNGDGTFRAPMRQGQGFRCWGLGLADLDGDGLLDLAICNHGDDRGYSSGVLVHLGRGDGTFGPARLFQTAWNPVSLAIADLNGDGKLDLITSNDGDDPDFDVNSMTILLGNGDGTFARGPELQTGEHPAFVAAGHVDSGATWDLVAVNQTDFSLSVFLGNGDGSFGTRDRTLVGRHPFGLAAADLDHDGRTDLVSANGGPYSGPGGVSLIRSRGDGTFDDPVDSGTGKRFFVGAADLNADTATDLVVTSASGVTAMLGGGGATFRELSETRLDPNFPGPPVLADLNHDGLLDVAVPLSGAGGVSVLIGRGDGSFGPGTRFAVVGAYADHAAAGDLDRDGLPDLVVGLGGYSVSVLLGHGDGTLAPAVTYDSHQYFANNAPVGLADIDEDGQLDVVCGNVVWLGNGDGTLRAGTRIVRYGDNGIVLEDFDGDHHVDAAFLSESRMVSVLPGRGDGTFGPPLQYGTGAGPRSMTAGDFDGDGRIDLAVSNYSESISILLNRSQAPAVAVRFELAPGTLSPSSQARWVIGTIETPSPYSAGDFDVGSIRLNGVVSVDRSAPSPERHGSRGLVVRFDRAALVAVLPAGEQVPVTITGNFGVRPFQATTTVRVLGHGVPEPPARVAFHPLGVRVLGPARAGANSLRFGIELAEESPARLDVIDVAGRVVTSRSLESLGRGSHEIGIASTLQPGIYFLRLRQGSLVAYSRAAILR